MPYKPPLLFSEYVIGASTLLSNDAETTAGGTPPTYAKVKEITITGVPDGGQTEPTRIHFEMKSGSGSFQVYGRIYKNGVAVGTERFNSSVPYVSYDEDMSLNLVVGDLIQLWSHGIVGYRYNQNFRILGSFTWNKFAHNQPYTGTNTVT